MSVHLGKRVERQLVVLGLASLLPFSALIYQALNDGAVPKIFQSFAHFNQATTIAAAVILFIVALSSVRMLRRKLKTLSRFEEATRTLTSGDYSHRIEINEQDEFHTLAKAFNELTDQLEDSMQSNRSLTDIDRLILNGEELDTILRRILISAKMDAIGITLLLRPDMSSVKVTTYRIDGKRMTDSAVELLDVTDDTLRDIDGYRLIANRVCGESILECCAVEGEGAIIGALVATGHRTLKASESKRLTDLVDRLSVAMTNIKRSESLYQQAHFDSLTGLINRHAFEDRLRESLSRSWRGEDGVLLFIDLDGFKKVNDAEGHEAGDRLLVVIAERLREALRPEDTIARLGGDEFAIIAPGCGDDSSVSPLCERIISSVIQPITVDRMEHTVGVSIGVALYPDDGQHLEELVMKADSAMYRAKSIGGSKFAFFDDSLNEANRHRLLVETRLRTAIKEGILQVHFQPKLNLKTWSVDCAEGLLRWNDEKLGDVAPDMFVEIAEETGLIHDILPILVERTADLISAAEQGGVLLSSVAINASPKQLMSEGFALALLSMLDARQVPHDRIELEVTESVFSRDVQQVSSELEILRSAGMKIALDDFGTGYSSLTLLRNLPLDVVKIDRAFITELETSDQARTMVQHLISIAGTLGLKVVAEGVESDVQLQHLVETQCDYIQGWLLSKARSEADFVSTLLDWQSSGQAGPPEIVQAIADVTAKH